MQLSSVPLEIPERGNLILGASHFIKTVEDLYEAIVNTAPQMKFGIAFCEASGPCLIRADGNDDVLKRIAIQNAQAVAAGHSFVIVMTDGFPMNILGRIKDVPEVVNLFCATANPAEAIIAESEQGRGIIGVIDGSPLKESRRTKTRSGATAFSARSGISDSDGSKQYSRLLTLTFCAK